MFSTHSKSCLTASIIAATENARDSMTFPEFVQFVQSTEVYAWATEYLREGTMPCRCVVAAWESVERRYESGDDLHTHGERAAAAESLAGAHMQNGTIDFNEYDTIMAELYSRA